MDRWQKGQNGRAREPWLGLLGPPPSTLSRPTQPSPTAAAFPHLSTASFVPSQPSSLITALLGSRQAPQLPGDILTLALAIPAVTSGPFPSPHHTAKSSFFDIEISHHQL